MFAESTFEELRLRSDIVWIDVRSEGEYVESTIPGAMNIPLFNNEERARIGTIYKQQSPAAARELGLATASAKLPALVQAISQVSGDAAPVVFCWRGGMRSKSVAAVLDLMGIKAVRLTGGYRAYRQHVTQRLTALTTDDLPSLIVLHGMTGVGKTLLLHQLAAEGEPTMDLEAWAGHRGSVFGGIGLVVANQRQFDSRLYNALTIITDATHCYIEAESKRIGRVYMPDFLFAAKLQGINIEVVAPIELRIARTMEQYHLDDQEAFYASACNAVERIEKRFSPDLRKRVRGYLETRCYEPMIAALLVEYYDPRYRHAMSAYEQAFVQVDGTDLTQAAAEIRELVQNGLKR